MNINAGTVILPVGGDIDMSSADELRTTIDLLIDDGCGRLILNMEKVGYVDSAGYAMLVASARRMRAAGGVLSLVGVQPNVYRTMYLARLVDFIPVTRMTSGTVPDIEPGARALWARTAKVEPDDLAATRSKVRAWLSDMRLTPDQVFDMTLACGEAMGNAVDHGCGCALVTLTAWPDRAVMEVTDCGCGFNCATGEVPKPEHGGNERGRGISLMRLLVDQVEISSRSRGEGTLVRLTKMIS